ncbi:MAG: zinc ribbon domain-containing protein [Planctomycetota bacterium]|jgi:uncharacterized membrane protein YdbT with pleckstrin-like domain
MFCQKCGVEIPDGSEFCNKCGASQKSEAVPAAAAPAPAAAPVMPFPAGGPPMPEEALWKGRFSGKALAHWWLLWFVEIVGLAILYWGVLGPHTREKDWPFYVVAAAAVLPLLWIVWASLVRKITVRYRLTTHRLFRERGLLSRTISEVELVRVDDVSVSQNLIQRIFNVGKVTVISTDASDPHTELVGIRDPIEVKELIRSNVRKWRDRALHMERLC